MESLRQGRDIHRLTAMRVTGKETPEEVADEERQLAKALNFGIICRNYWCSRATKSRSFCATYNGHSTPKLIGRCVYCALQP